MIHEAGRADLPVGLDARQRVPAAFVDRRCDLGIEELPEHKLPAAPLRVPTQRAHAGGGNLLHRAICKADDVRAWLPRLAQEQFDATAEVPTGFRLEEENGLGGNLGLIYAAEF